MALARNIGPCGLIAIMNSLIGNRQVIYILCRWITSALCTKVLFMSTVKTYPVVLNISTVRNFGNSSGRFNVVRNLLGQIKHNMDH